MSLVFGPTHLGVTPRSADDVRVYSLPTGTPADLSSPVMVDSFGNVTFAVAETGRYQIVANDGTVKLSRTVFLTDKTTYDITDPRSYAKYSPEVGEGAPGGGGGGVTDHGQLTGLSDDDHPQYLTYVRANAQYARIVDLQAVQTEVDGKQPSGDYASDSDITLLQGQIDGINTYLFVDGVQIPVQSITDSGTVGRDVVKSETAEQARTAIGAGTSDLALGTTSTTAKAGNYQPTAEDISNATTVGRNVLKAVDAAAARTAIGAGTSSLAIGTTGSTAKAGNYQPTAANISDATTTGRSVLTAADAAAARTAIGAGTSNLAIGTTGTTAKVGTYTPPIADLPAGSVLYADKPSGGSWPARPTTRTDIKVIWTGASPAPAIVTSPSTAGAYDGDKIDLIS